MQNTLNEMMEKIQQQVKLALLVFYLFIYVVYELHRHALSMKLVFEDSLFFPEKWVSRRKMCGLQDKLTQNWLSSAGMFCAESDSTKQCP